MSTDHTLLLSRIASRLHDLFGTHIKLADVASKSEKDREDYFRTRALAALSLMDEADLDPTEAADCVTDGGEDDGIDAVYIDPKKQIIYFVQSKWRSSAKGIQLNDFTRFRDGIKKAISLEWDSDNKNLHRFAQHIESALKQNIDTSVVMLFIHTSSQKIAKNIQSKIDSFLTEQNQYINDFAQFKEIDLAKVTQIARSKTRTSNIDIRVMLLQWGMLSTPYKAIYGQISAADIAKWHDDYGHRLFAENLRYIIEKSDVNESIFETATKEPDNFWYFNNGITAICDSFDKLPIGGNRNLSGTFDVKKISVINGAQTVGSIAKAKSAGATLDEIYVHLRIISLVGTPEGFSSRVTRYNNTQNDLNAVDFVSQDPNQERISKEAAQLGIHYSYRRGEAEPAPAVGFTIRSATIAAACASGDLRYAVSAKRYISGLWEDVLKEPYTKLFNDKTTATYLWNIVRLMNAVDSRLSNEAASLAGRARLTAIHGNRFILFYVFNKIDLKDAHKSGFDLLAVQSDCEKRASDCLKSLIPIVEKKYPDSYPGNIFKNQDRQAEILKLI